MYEIVPIFLVFLSAMCEDSTKMGPLPEAARNAFNLRLEVQPSAARTAARTAAFFCQQQPQQQPQQEPQQEPQSPQEMTALSALPPDFTAIELPVCESAWRTYELLVNKIKREQGELLEFIQLQDPGQWFALTSCRNVENTWAATIYRRMVALPKPPVPLVKITKLMADGTLQQRIVFLLKNEPSAKMTHDDFYIAIPEDNDGCPIELMWDTTRVPIVLYSRVTIDASYFKKTDTTEALERLFVKVDDCVLGVPPEVEFLMVAYSQDSALISVYPGPQLLARLRKHNNWALNFIIPHESCINFKNFFTLPPVVSDWTISEVKGFAGQFLENVEYQPAGDFFDRDIYDTLMEDRIAMMHPCGEESEELQLSRWGTFSAYLLRKYYRRRLRKKRWEYRKYARLCRNYLKLDRHTRNAQLLPDRFQLLQERLTRRKQEVSKLEISTQALRVKNAMVIATVVSGFQQLQEQLQQVQEELKRVQQEHALQLQQVQQEHQTVQQQLATAQEEAQKPGPEQTLCLICMEKLANVVMTPCHHLCVCDNCYPSLTFCPICRGPITAHFNTVQVPVIQCTTCRKHLPNMVLLPCAHQVLCETCVAANAPAVCPVCQHVVDDVLKIWM